MSRLIKKAAEGKISNTTHICRLTDKQQEIVKSKIVEFLKSEGYSESEMTDIVKNAMDGRLCDLEDNLNVNALITELEVI